MSKANTAHKVLNTDVSTDKSVLSKVKELTRKLNEQLVLLEELALVQEILSTMCHVSLYQISIYQAVRNREGEITDFRIQKVNLNNGSIHIEDFRTAKSDEVSQQIIRQFNQPADVNNSEYEFGVDDKNGQTQWFLNKLIVFKRTKTGLPQQVILITQDITEKKSGELLTLEKQKIITSVTDASPDMLFILNLPGLELAYTNKAVNEIFHYSHDQIIKMGGAFMQEHTHPEDREKVMEYFRAVSEQKDFPLKELHYRMMDAFGNWHHIRCRHSIFKTDKNGLPTQLIGVKQDITEFKKNQEKRIRSKIKRQQEISNAILQTQEAERKRIAEALHNSLGQVLYGAKLKLDMLDVDSGGLPKNNKEIKASVCELIDTAIAETRTISFELMPATLEDFGLDTAINDMLRNKLAKTGIKYKAFISGLKSRLDPDVEIAMFRIVQELINNLVKHSRATKAEVTVNRGADYVMIKVSDNGTGFTPVKKFPPGKGFGLRSIINRVKFMNGKINFDQPSPSGSMITIDIPL